MAAMPPVCFEAAPFSMASTACAPSGPSSSRNCAVSDPRTASWPNMMPATLMTISRRGPSEKTE